MADTKPIPVRLDNHVINRLDDAANKIGSNRAAVIRFCVETWLSHFEKKGFAALPVDWEKIMEELDGRTRKSRVSSIVSSTETEGRAGDTERQRKIEAGLSRARAMVRKKLGHT